MSNDDLQKSFHDLKRAFIKTVLIQGALLSAACWLWAPTETLGRTFLWTFIYALAALASLVTTARVVFLLISNASQPDYAEPVGLFFWVTAKIFSFGILATLIFFGGKFRTDFALLAGLTTFIVVPILGSFFWRERESRHASRA